MDVAEARRVLQRDLLTEEEELAAIRVVWLASAEGANATARAPRQRKERLSPVVLTHRRARRAQRRRG